MRETWYVLEDGSAVDPNEVEPHEGGLRHKGGGMVALRGDAFSSRGVDPEEERAKAARAKDLKPEEPKFGYKTRDAKAK